MAETLKSAIACTRDEVFSALPIGLKWKGIPAPSLHGGTNRFHSVVWSNDLLKANG
jgi:hypothetical protein